MLVCPRLLDQSVVALYALVQQRKAGLRFFGVDLMVKVRNEKRVSTDVHQLNQCLVKRVTIRRQHVRGRVLCRQCSNPHDLVRRKAWLFGREQASDLESCRQHYCQRLSGRKKVERSG